MRSTILPACFSLILATLGACGDSSSTDATGTRTPSATEVTPSDLPTSDHAAECPNQAEVTSDPSARIGGSLRGDVDGDGGQDEVSLAFDQKAAQGCQAFLVVEGGDETHVLAIQSFDSAYGLPQPRLNALTDVDPVPGSEIVVDLVAGASTQFVGLFTLTGGALARVRIEDYVSPVADLFPYGGSVGHLEASNCADDTGMVVISTATPKGADYRVTRRFFRFEGLTLRGEPSATERERVALEDLDRFPEYESSPFGGC
jgi:hypothetical protein